MGGSCCQLRMLASQVPSWLVHIAICLAVSIKSSPEQPGTNHLVLSGKWRSEAIWSSAPIKVLFLRSMRKGHSEYVHKVIEQVSSGMAHIRYEFHLHPLHLERFLARASEMTWKNKRIDDEGTCSLRYSLVSKTRGRKDRRFFRRIWPVQEVIRKRWSI